MCKAANAKFSSSDCDSTLMGLKVLFNKSRSRKPETF